MTVIAIDGPAGSGKTTVARAVALRMGLEYLDTGSMYRSATLAALRAGVALADESAVARIVAAAVIDVGPVVMLDGSDVSGEIRGEAVSDAVSIVAALPLVRDDMRRRQRAWAADNGGCVVEGRDIGSVVFPDADLKVFLTASPEVRARRRASESGGADEATVAKWAANIAERDHLDTTRDDSPLIEADGARSIDTTDLSIDEIVELIAAAAP
jgi:cytidylate kinase